MGIKTTSSSSEPSENLIFHVHGGGWASQTPISHETYLREWAVSLDIPIFSIDYSLGPEVRFPRAIEEVFYAYCWVLNNPELVGSTGKNIIFVGDSAGGNLATACVVKCIEMGIRKPKGLFNIYAPFSIGFAITPARFLSLVDPVLPYSFLTILLTNYGCSEFIPCDEKVGRHKEFNVKFHESPLLSPYLASDEILKQFPPSKLLCCSFDPNVDDSVYFGKRLKGLGVETTLDVVSGLSHGFLYFTQVRNISDLT